MGLLVEIKKRFRRLAGLTFGLLVLGYFTYHLVVGDRGLLAYWRLEDLLAKAENHHAALISERAMWEQKVRLLRADHLDLDLLEERARAVLSLGRAEEYYIITPPERGFQDHDGRQSPRVSH